MSSTTAAPEALARSLAAARRAVRLAQGPDQSRPLDGLGFLPFRLPIDGVEVHFAVTAQGIIAFPAEAAASDGISVAFTELDRHYDPSSLLYDRVTSMIVDAEDPTQLRQTPDPAQTTASAPQLASADTPSDRLLDRLSESLDHTADLVSALPEPGPTGSPLPEASLTSPGLAGLARTISAAVEALADERPGEAWTQLTALWEQTQQTWREFTAAADRPGESGLSRTYGRLIELTARVLESIGALAVRAAGTVSTAGPHDSVPHRVLLALSRTARDAADDLRMFREPAPTPQLGEIAARARSDMQASRDRITDLGVEARAYASAARNELAQHGSDTRSAWSLRSALQRLTSAITTDTAHSAQPPLTPAPGAADTTSLGALADLDADTTASTPQRSAADPAPPGEHAHNGRSRTAPDLPDPIGPQEKATQPPASWRQRPHGALTDWRLNEALADALETARSADQAADQARAAANPGPAHIEEAARQLNPALAARYQALHTDPAPDNATSTASRRPGDPAEPDQPAVAAQWQSLLASVRENAAAHADTFTIHEMTALAAQARTQAAAYREEIATRASLAPARALAEATERAAALAAFATASIDRTHALSDDAPAPNLERGARAQV